MDKRLRLLCAVIGIGLLSGFVWLARSNREPLYCGKNLSCWLADLDLQSSSSPDQAVKAVRAIGTNALPELTRMVQARDPFWKQTLLALNARQSLIEIPVMPANLTRSRAVQGYSVLGASAKQAVAPLIHLVESEPRTEVRLDVIAALGAIGPDANSAIPILLKIALEDPNADLRKSAFIALANIRRWDKPGFERRF